MPTVNKALIESILDGNEERFAEIVQKYDARVRSAIRAAGADAHTLEEIVHETFCLAFRNLGQLRQPEHLGAWLTQIARRRLAEHRRTTARMKANQEQHEHASEEASDINEDDWIWDEVDQLPESFRDVLRLRYQYNLTYAELATRLGVPVSTIRGRIYEARRILKQRLQERDLGPW